MHDRAGGAAMARPGRHQPAPQRESTRRACANIDLVAAEIVERFQHQPEGLVAQRIVARLTLDKIVGLEHRHRATDDDHRRVDRLEPRIEKLVLEPEFVQHVADCCHEKLAPGEPEQVGIGLPKRGHDRPSLKLVLNSLLMRVAIHRARRGWAGVRLKDMQALRDEASIPYACCLLIFVHLRCHPSCRSAMSVRTPGPGSSSSARFTATKFAGRWLFGA